MAVAVAGGWWLWLWLWLAVLAVALAVAGRSGSLCAFAGERFARVFTVAIGQTFTTLT